MIESQPMKVSELAQETGIPEDRIVEIVNTPSRAETSEILTLQEAYGKRIGAMYINVDVLVE